MQVLSKKRYPARLEYLQQFMEAISHCAKEQGFNQKRISEIELAAEEVLVNIFNYAYQGNEGDVEVICKLDPQDRLIIEMLDSGVPFDMLSLGEPDTTADISERKVGGLGMFLIRKLMDDVQYRREGTKNVLSLIVNKNKGKE
jgi:anti-sigma regulatory factor (Ser/Thr protein kinase)